MPSSALNRVANALGVLGKRGASVLWSFASLARSFFTAVRSAWTAALGWAGTPWLCDVLIPSPLSRPPSHEPNVEADRSVRDSSESMNGLRVV